MNNADEALKKLYDTRFYRKLSLKLRDDKKSIIKVNENFLSYIDELWTSLSDHFLLPPLSVLLEKIHIVDVLDYSRKDCPHYQLEGYISRVHRVLSREEYHPHNDE